MSQMKPITKIYRILAPVETPAPEMQPKAEPLVAPTQQPVKVGAR